MPDDIKPEEPSDALPPADSLIEANLIIEAKHNRWADLTAKPDELLENICAHVASGGSLIDLAETWRVNYGLVSIWVRGDEKRNARYVTALNDRGEWAKEMILREYRSIATTDIADVFTEGGKLRNVHEIPATTRRCIASIETDELFEGVGRDRVQVGETKKIKFWDKGRALQDLGKTMGMFIDVTKHEVGQTIEDLIMMSRKPKEEEPK